MPLMPQDPYAAAAGGAPPAPPGSPGDIPFPGDPAGGQMGPDNPALPPGQQDPMMDQTPPDPAEMAQLLGGTIAQQRQAAHMMVDQAADADLQHVIQLIEQAAQGGQILGAGQPA